MDATGEAIEIIDPDDDEKDESFVIGDDNDYHLESIEIINKDDDEREESSVNDNHLELGCVIPSIAFLSFVTVYDPRNKVKNLNKSN